MTHSWDGRIEDFMSFLHNKNEVSNKSINPIPAINIFLNLSLLSTLVISFFLENDEEITEQNGDIFTQIKDKMKYLVSQEIVETEIDKQIKDFRPIKDLLLKYLVTQGYQRSILVKELVKECGLFFKNLLKNEKTIHLIPFTITFEIVHLTVLRESLKLQMSSVGEMKEVISHYQSHFANSFNQFFTWRANQITTTTSISNDLKSESLFIFRANGEVRDKIGNKVVNYFAKSSNDQIFIKVFDLIKLRMLNEAKAEFMKMFLHISSLIKLISDYKTLRELSWPLNIKNFWVGPYGIDTFPDGSHNLEDNSRLFYNITEDDPGVITRIKIRSWDRIDCIKAYYDCKNCRSGNLKNDCGNCRVGKKIGMDGGREQYISDLNDFSRYIIAINLKFAWGLLSAIEFIFNDGKSTGLFGTKENEPITGTVQIGPFGKHNEFRLSGIIGGGGSTTTDPKENVAHIAFQFQYVDSL